MEDYLSLNIPTFQVPYKRWKKYGYANSDEKENLKAVLNESSGGYCMYCYSRLQMDHKWSGNLEHAIEKSNSEKLIECIPNIGMACSTCNQSFKRIGERKRKIEEPARRKFEEQSRCSLEKRKQCTIPCKALRELQKMYSAMEDAEIVLQPMGIAGGSSKEPFLLQYDVLDMEFRPNTTLHTYSEEELHFINKHICRFHLNDPQYKTSALVDFIRNIIDSGGNLPVYEYGNLIVQIFADKLKKKTKKERLNICSKIYPIMFLKTLNQNQKRPPKKS